MSQERNQPEPIIIQETVSPRVIEALMSNYRDAQHAFMELIDNAVDNREEGNPLIVRITVNKNMLAVQNQGGKGLDLDGLRSFFVWGYSEKTSGQIGFYGVGGKAAMGFLGRSMEVTCTARGQDTEYKVSDPSWETRQEEEWKQFVPQIQRAKAEDGYFRVRITNVKRDVNSTALQRRLADIYRPLLLDNRVIMTLNNKRIEPIEIKYVENDPKLQPEPYRIATSLGERFIMRAGVLSEGQSVKPGIRCYYRGRLIEDEQFFGHPTPAQMSQMSRLIGEAHLDFVPVTSNKATFIHDSVQWEAAASQINQVLKPWVEKLSQLRIQERNPIENYEKELAKSAKRILEHVFATTGLVTKLMIPGESFGRRPPSPRQSPPPTPTGRKGGPGPQEGQTAPTLDATIGQMRRWGAMYDWDVVSMGANGKRSDIVQESGKDVLKINSDHPLYQVEKAAGDLALETYMAETAVRKICEVTTRGKSIEEYEDLVDTLIRDSAALYQNRVNERVRRAARTRARTQNP